MTLATKEADSSYHTKATIKLNMKFPTNIFELYVSDNLPNCLKCSLALEYKLLYYKDIEFNIVKLTPYQYDLLKIFEERSGVYSLPQVKIRYKNGIDETWIGGAQNIIRFLDAMYPANSLYHSNKQFTHLDVLFLDDWIEQSLGQTLEMLMFLNPNNLERISRRWLDKDPGFWGKLRLKKFQKKKIESLCLDHLSPDKAYAAALKRLDYELLPLIVDKLEISIQNGYPYLLGSFITAADLGVYSYLKVLTSLDEASLINRRGTLKTFMNMIEGTPLNQNNFMSGGQAKTGRPLLLTS
jgi:glutathione S-transferase